MDYDQFVPIIIFLIIWGVASAIRKSPKEGDQQKGAEAPGSKLLALLQNRLEEFVEEKPEEIVEMDQYMEPVGEKELPKSKMDVSRNRRTKSPSPPLNAEQAAQMGKTINLASIMAGQRPLAVQAEERGRVCRKKTISLNRRDLKKAVIWSEIIGPPISLRDQ